jgi:hypothetical protein
MQKKPDFAQKQFFTAAKDIFRDIVKQVLDNVTWNTDFGVRFQ